jgi:hypothetical protein
MIPPYCLSLSCATRTGRPCTAGAGVGGRTRCSRLANEAKGRKQPMYLAALADRAAHRLYFVSFKDQVFEFFIAFIAPKFYKWHNVLNYIGNSSNVNT